MCVSGKGLICIIAGLYFHSFILAQGAAGTIDGSTRQFIRNGDTLISGSGSQIVVGQRVKIGKGSGENGWYKSIGLKSAASWLLLLFHDTEIKNQYAYSGDPEQERENDKVRDYLREGDSLLVTKIKRSGNKKHGYNFMIFLRDGKFPAINYRCNVQIASDTGEIILEQ